MSDPDRYKSRGTQDLTPNYLNSSGGHPSGFAKLHLFLSILTPSGAKLHLANCTLRVSKVDTSDETL